jgi:glycosyltransferase involved in cell wall biosynthesis
VITIHDLTYYYYPETFPGGEIVRRRLERAVRASDHALCDTENTRQDAIRTLGLPSEKTTVVHLGVNLPQNDPAPRFNASDPFLLYVGQRGGYKNFKWLLEVLARNERLADSRLVAFGGGGFTASENTLISDLGLRDRIGHQSGDDLALTDLYRRAGVLVYPSLYEGFGLPVLEAMAHGCPVVCSEISSLPEVGGDAALTFPPGDPQAFAKAVGSVLSDVQFRRQTVERGYQRAREFSWEKCADKTLRLYRSLVSEQ